MEKPMKYKIFALLLCLLAACTGRTPLDADVFDEVVYSPSQATGFEIRRHAESGATLIISTNPWQGADKVAYKL